MWDYIAHKIMVFLDRICDLFGCTDYVQGYVIILLVILVAFAAFEIAFNAIETRRDALHLLRYKDYEAYLEIRRRDRARVVLMQRLILAVFVWPLLLPLFLWKWVNR